MIVMDLDGTLLNSNKECSEISKEYLNKLKNTENIIVIATGRTLLSAIRVTDGSSFANYIISNGGSIIYHVDSQKIIYKNKIGTEIIRDLYLNYQNQVQSFVICDTDFYHRYNPLQLLSLDDRQIENVCDFLATNPEIIHCCFHPKETKDILKIKVEAQTKYPMLEMITMQDSFSSNQWLDIFSKNVSKYYAIKVLADLYNIENKDIIAFGDGLNDKEMLLKCGIGVAMGNALEKVKTVADNVTLSNNEDGVVVFLKQFLEEQRNI